MRSGPLHRRRFLLLRFYCHCSRCRRRTGSAFASIGGIAIDKMQVTGAREHLLIEDENSDGYGVRCSKYHGIHVSLGVLIETPSRLPDHHIHVASKGSAYLLNRGPRIIVDIVAIPS
jgi:hypothetical protein